MTKHISSEVSVPNPLLNFSKQRSTDIVAKLRKAMSLIEKEIEEQEGLYPFNKGRLTQAEVCRRAGVSKVTLQGSQHKATTKVEVDEWVERVTSGIVKGKKNVRKAITDRAETWKADLKEIAQRYHESELSRSDLQRQVAELTEKVRILERKHVRPI